MSRPPNAAFTFLEVMIALAIVSLVVTSSLVLANLTLAGSAEMIHRHSAQRLANHLLMAAAMGGKEAPETTGSRAWEGLTFEWTLSVEPYYDWPLHQRTVTVSWRERGSLLEIDLKEFIRPPHVTEGNQ